MEKTPVTTEDSLSVFKYMIQTETDLQFPENDSEFLLRFLHVAKYDLKKALDRLKRYYKAREQYKTDYENMKPSGLLPLLKQNILGILRVRHEDGSAILFVKISNWNTNKCSPDHLFAVVALSLEKAIEESETQISGLKVVADVSGFTFSHLKVVGIGLLVKFAKLLTGVLPLRITGIHLVNAPSLFNAIYFTLKMLLTPKLRSRYVLHGELESLYKHVSRECLPSDIGGSQPEFDNSEHVQQLLDWEPTWEKYMTYGTRKTPVGGKN